MIEAIRYDMDHIIWYDNVFCNLKFFVNSETVLNLLRLSSKIDAKVIAKKKNRAVTGPDTELDNRRYYMLWSEKKNPNSIFQYFVLSGFWNKFQNKTLYTKHKLKFAKQIMINGLL